VPTIYDVLEVMLQILIIEWYIVIVTGTALVNLSSMYQLHVMAGGTWPTLT